jgi:hypothetical protein
MAYPIVDKGTSVQELEARHVRLEKRTSKQARPYNLPADYRKARRTVTGTGSYDYVDAFQGFNPWYMSVPMSLSSSDNLVNAPLLKARERFVGKVQEKANWAVNLAEREQAISMMTARLGQMYQFCRHLRRGDIRGVAGLLGTKDLGNARGASRKFSKNFLEWHFGWSPLIQDIYNSAEILSQDFDTRVCSGSATERYELTGSATSGGQWANRGTQRFSVSCRVAGSYRVTNPNLRLASQMGLTNPATVAWELVPFSFVVDWFINIGDFLAQWDEFVGITLVEPYYSYRVRATGSFRYWSEHPSNVGALFGTISSALEQFDRVRGLPALTLTLNRGQILSVSRAVTACALLVQKGIRG